MNATILTSAQVESNLKSMCERHSENTSYRMENYLNCVDDYSWGGICDQAQAQSEQTLRMILDAVKQQETNGGYLIQSASELELQTLDGKLISTNIVNGKYGACFMYGCEQDGGVKFVGLSKKQSTFEKKGFRVVTKNYQLKVIFTGKTTSKGNAQRIVELISVSESVDASVNCSIDNRDYSLFLLKSSLTHINYNA